MSSIFVSCVTLLVAVLLVGTVLGKRRFIFTISPGYSGSGSLRRLLNSASDVTAFHEKKPALVDFHFVLKKGLNKTYARRKAAKMPTLADDLLQPPFDSNPDMVYCDTSHLWHKSWYDVFLDEYLVRCIVV